MTATQCHFKHSKNVNANSAVIKRQGHKPTGIQHTQPHMPPCAELVHIDLSASITFMQTNVYFDAALLYNSCSTNVMK